MNNTKKNGNWINKEYKNCYLDSEKKGLRLHFEKSIYKDHVYEIKNFIKFLKKYYYFPIRCDLFFCNQINFLSFDRKKKCKGIFIKGEEKIKKYPKIYVPCKINSFWTMENVFLSIVRLLTYYYQWYFYEDEKRTNRSLEIEATKYANFLVEQFYAKQ